MKKIDIQRFAETTPTLGLTKPAVTDNYDINIQNANMDILDSSIEELQTKTSVSWTNLTFPNEDFYPMTGGSYNIPAYCKMGDLLILRGLIGVKTEGTGDFQVCKIANSSAWPTKKVYFCSACSSMETNNGQTPLVLTLSSDGIIRIHGCFVVGWLSLDGVILSLGGN